MATYLEIQEQIKKLQAQAEQIREAELASVIAELKGKIQQFGLTAEQLGFGGAKSSRKKASSSKPVALYRNENGETWTGAGRGRKPTWVKEILDAGGDIEKYRI